MSTTRSAGCMALWLTRINDSTAKIADTSVLQHGDCESRTMAATMLGAILVFGSFSPPVHTNLSTFDGFDDKMAGHGDSLSFTIFFNNYVRFNVFMFVFCSRSFREPSCLSLPLFCF